MQSCIWQLSIRCPLSEVSWEIRRSVLVCFLFAQSVSATPCAQSPLTLTMLAHHTETSENTWYRLHYTHTYTACELQVDPHIILWIQVVQVLAPLPGRTGPVLLVSPIADTHTHTPRISNGVVFLYYLESHLLLCTVMYILFIYLLSLGT